MPENATAITRKKPQPKAAITGTSIILALYISRAVGAHQTTHRENTNGPKRNFGTTGDDMLAPAAIADNGRREQPAAQSWDSCIIGPGFNFQIVHPSPCRPTRRAEIPSREDTSRIQSDPCIMVESELHDVFSSARGASSQWNPFCLHSNSAGRIGVGVGRHVAHILRAHMLQDVRIRVIFLCQTTRVFSFGPFLA